MTPVAKGASLVAGALILVLVGGWWQNRQNHLLRDARQEAEASKLILKGQIVAEAETNAALRADIDALLRTNEALKKAYDDARSVTPGSKPVRVSHLETGPLPVHSPPVSAPSSSIPASASAGDLGPPVQAPNTAPCALTTDDRVSLEVDQIEIQAREGSHLVVGTASAYRSLPRSLLVSGPFKAPLSDANALALPPPPRWGALLLGACGSVGCGLGAGVLLPPVSVLTLRVETFVGVLALPGLLAAEAGVGVRW